MATNKPLSKNHKEIIEILKFSIDKAVKKSYKKLEKIIYSFKTGEDVLNFMIPYIEKGYYGVKIFNDDQMWQIKDGINLNPLESHIFELTNGEFMFEAYVTEYILALVNHDVPGHLCNAYYSSICISDDGINDNKNNIDALKNNISEIQQKINVLDMTMREVYNAPGMPGFEQTNKHYMQHIRRKSL